MPTLRWSQRMEDLFNKHVTLPVLDDVDSDWNRKFGYTINVIRDEIIQKGLADFREGYSSKGNRTLTADEKVLLYCFVNMKQHYFEAISTFRAYEKRLKPLFELGQKTIVFDLGCGPGTAGLALAECFVGVKPKLQYIGVDLAPAMRQMARSMLNDAIENSLFATGSNTAFRSTWNAVNDLATKITVSCSVLINASYLFASDSLDVDHVSDFVRALKKQARVKTLLLTYANSTDSRAGKKFTEFKQKLENEYKTTGHKQATLTFQKKRSDIATVDRTYVRQLLRFKE